MFNLRVLLHCHQLVPSCMRCRKLWFSIFYKFSIRAFINCSSCDGKEGISPSPMSHYRGAQIYLIAVPFDVGCSGLWSLTTQSVQLLFCSGTMVTMCVPRWQCSVSKPFPFSSSMVFPLYSRNDPNKENEDCRTGTLSLSIVEFFLVGTPP